MRWLRASSVVNDGGSVDASNLSQLENVANSNLNVVLPNPTNNGVGIGTNQGISIPVPMVIDPLLDSKLMYRF